MEVNKILKLCATMLQLRDIDEFLRSSDVVYENSNDDLKLLLDCVNIVCNTIATDYIYLTKTRLIDNKNGNITWREISAEPIYKIIKVRNVYGDNVQFSINANGIECDKGSVSITYSYFPKDYGYNDVIDVFNAQLTERVFAFGVVSEYLFIRGNSDDASIWEDRFKNSMRNVVRVKKEVVLPRRRWW